MAPPSFQKVSLRNFKPSSVSGLVRPKSRVPNLDFPRALVAAGRREVLAVRAEGHAPDPAGQSVECPHLLDLLHPHLLDLLQTSNVPDDDLFPAGGGEVLSVPAESQASYVVGV